MKRYTKEMIFSYIRGLDINANIDILEDDIEFMMEVITYSKDKNFYYLCSKRLKNDPNFIKFLIEKFKDDEDFILQLSEKFLKNSENADDIAFVEIYVLFSRYLHGEKNFRFKFFLRSFYELHMESFQLEIFNESDEEIAQRMGKGFWLVQYYFIESDIIRRFFAETMILDFFNDVISLEKVLHNTFNSVQDFNKVGNKQFLVSLIASYDEMLSGYVEAHIDIIDYWLKRVDYYLTRWDSYVNKNEEDTINMIFSCISEFCQNLEYEIDIFEFEIIKYIATEFNLDELFRKYDPIYDRLYEDIGEFNLIMNFNDLIKLKILKDDIRRILKDNHQLESKPQTTEKCKILKFEPKKK